MRPLRNISLHPEALADEHVLAAEHRAAMGWFVVEATRLRPLLGVDFTRAGQLPLLGIWPRGRQPYVQALAWNGSTYAPSTIPKVLGLHAAYHSDYWDAYYCFAPDRAWSVRFCGWRNSELHATVAYGLEEDGTLLHLQTEYSEPDAQLLGFPGVPYLVRAKGEHLMAASRAGRTLDGLYTQITDGAGWRPWQLLARDGSAPGRPRRAEDFPMAVQPQRCMQLAHIDRVPLGRWWYRRTTDGLILLHEDLCGAVCYAAYYEYLRPDFMFRQTLLAPGMLTSADSSPALFARDWL